MQIHQLLPGQCLQRGLQARQLGAEGRARAGDPVKALRRRRLGQARQLLRAAARLQMEDADRL